MVKQTVAIGTIGYAREDIEKGKNGDAVFPTLAYRIIEIHALTKIHEYAELIIVDERNGAREQSPSNVRQLGQPHDDYTEISFTDTAVKYIIGTEAKKADDVVPLFEAQVVYLTADQDCWIQFNGSKKVKHRLEANVRREYRRRCTEVWVTRVTVNGTLKIEAIG